MNQAARLQALGGFRETLLMESAREALSGSKEPWAQGLKFGPLAETPVKNVGQPLRYYKLV
jgi:class 3 adenylate cyclase